MNAEDTLNLIELFKNNSDLGYEMNEIIEEVDPESQSKLITVVIDMQQVGLFDKEGKHFFASANFKLNATQLQAEIETIGEKLD